MPDTSTETCRPTSPPAASRRITWGLYEGSEDTIEMVNINTGTVQYFGFQCGDGSVFQDKNVRLAFAHAIDRQSIADYVFGGQASITDSFAVESVIGYTEDAVHYDYDPELAQEYLSKSSYSGEPVVWFPTQVPRSPRRACWRFPICSRPLASTARWKW